MNPILRQAALWVNQGIDRPTLLKCLGLAEDEAQELGALLRRRKLHSRNYGYPIMNDVLCAVAQVTGISALHIQGPRRTPIVAHARQMAMMLMYEHCHLSSYTKIGDFMDRDHSTVRHGVLQAKRRKRVEEAYASQAERAVAAIRAIMARRMERI